MAVKAESVNFQDTKYLERFSHIIGIDEVGRGCWAGPVTVGAFVLTAQTELHDLVRDSKQLSAKQRDQCADVLLSNEDFHYIHGSPQEIDTKGIAKVIEELIAKLIIHYSKLSNTLFVVDGRFKIDFGANTKQVIKADQKYYSVAAAAIIAKVARDRMMVELGKEYLGFGFEQHKGYGTKQHSEALSQFGVTELHRMSFRPMKNFASY